MSEIAKAYEPKEVEQNWYAKWLEAGCFKGSADPEREPYAIMIPPPNVTGMLHMGHVLDNTIQDIFVRRARLEGKAVLWQPGTDHAGIATTFWKKFGSSASNQGVLSSINLKDSARHATGVVLASR
jgi:valyl-tRNA synthetase